MSRWLVTNLGILVGILLVFFFLMAFVPIEGVSNENTFASRLEAGLGSFILWTLWMTPMAVLSLLILWKAGRRMDPGSQREMAFLLSPITGLVVIVVLLINAGTFPVVVALLHLVAPLVLFALFLRLPEGCQNSDSPT